MPGLDSGEIPRAVQGIGERVVDRLDVGVGEDVGVGAERSLHSVPVGDVLGATAVPGRYGDTTMARDAGGSDDGEVRDPAAPSTPIRIGAAVVLPIMRIVLAGQPGAWISRSS